jgi:undecaprenyl-diphosphatase
MIELIKSFDTKLFLLLNSWNCPAMDTFFYYATNRFVWIPLYVFLFVLVIKRFKSNAWKMMLMIVVLIVCSDQVSVLIKENVRRYRPCHNLDIQGKVHKVNNKCGGRYGFVSSHATNTMALFVFLALAVFRHERKIVGLLAFYVILVSYSRVYLGVHYPGDIIGGWILGLLIAVILFSLLKRSIHGLTAIK